MGVQCEYFVQTLGSTGRPTETCLKPSYVMPYVGIRKLFAVWDYYTQGSPGLQHAKKFA